MKTLVRSSEHLREALDLRVTIDKDGKPKIVSKKKLVLLGKKMSGDKEWKLKRA